MEGRSQAQISVYHMLHQTPLGQSHALGYHSLWLCPSLSHQEASSASFVLLADSVMGILLSGPGAPNSEAGSLWPFPMDGRPGRSGSSLGSQDAAS